MEENMEITRFFSGLALTFARLKDVRTPTLANSGFPKKVGSLFGELDKEFLQKAEGISGWKRCSLSLMRP